MTGAGLPTVVGRGRGQNFNVKCGISRSCGPVRPVARVFDVNAGFRSRCGAGSIGAERRPHPGDHRVQQVRCLAVPGPREQWGYELTSKPAAFISSWSVFMSVDVEFTSEAAVKTSPFSYAVTAFWNRPSALL